MYILDTSFLLVSFYHINHSEYFVLPHNMYRILRSAPQYVQNTSFCPTICTEYFVLPHNMYRILCSAPQYVQNTSFCPTICKEYLVLPHDMYRMAVSVGAGKRK
jgi:hypothetical protein